MVALALKQYGIQNETPAAQGNGGFKFKSIQALSSGA